jgi:hypothetical protein
MVADDPPLAKGQDPLADKDCPAAGSGTFTGWYLAVSPGHGQVGDAGGDGWWPGFAVLSSFDFLVIAVTRRAGVIVRFTRWLCAVIFGADLGRWYRWRAEGGRDMPRLTGVALGSGSDGLLELVATTEAHGSSATVWHAREVLPENWSGWQPLGKPGRGDPGGVSVIRQPFGARLEAFIVDIGEGAVWHSWQFTDPDTGWSDWDLLGNPGGHHAGGAVVLTFLPDDRVMAVVDAGGSVWHVSPPRAGAKHGLASVVLPRPPGRRAGAGCRGRIPGRRPGGSGSAKENPRHFRARDWGAG